MVTNVSSGKQWESQLGASMALIDAGMVAIKASGNPKSKAADRESALHPEDDGHDRQDRLHERTRPERVDDQSGRRAMGQEQRGQ